VNSLAYYKCLGNLKHYTWLKVFAVKIHKLSAQKNLVDTPYISPTSQGIKPADEKCVTEIRPSKKLVRFTVNIFRTKPGMDHPKVLPNDRIWLPPQ
jgi:hypothetical protein